MAKTDIVIWTNTVIQTNTVIHRKLNLTQLTLHMSSNSSRPLSAGHVPEQLLVMPRTAQQLSQPISIVYGVGSNYRQTFTKKVSKDPRTARLCVCPLPASVFGPLQPEPSIQAPRWDAAEIELATITITCIVPQSPIPVSGSPARPYWRRLVSPAQTSPVLC